MSGTSAGRSGPADPSRRAANASGNARKHARHDVLLFGAEIAAVRIGDRAQPRVDLREVVVGPDALLDREQTVGDLEAPALARGALTA